MHYVYILKNKKNDTMYIGVTRSVVKRLEEHNTGRSPATRRYMPWTCIYLEGYISKDDATNREYQLKQFGQAYSQLKRRLKYSLLVLEKVRD